MLMPSRQVHLGYPVLIIHNHSTAQMRLTTSLTAQLLRNGPSSKATSVSKSERDTIAERAQKIVLSFVVLVAYPEAFDLVAQVVA
jgi:hypothetical protein